LSKGIIDYLIESIHSSKHTRLLYVSLLVTYQILLYGEATSPADEVSELSVTFQEKGGTEALEELSQHPHEDIYQSSVKILEKFYDGQEEPQDLM
jgi:hypothetical protein